MRALCVGLCLFFASAIGSHVAATACGFSNSCAASSEYGVEQPRVNPDSRYLHNIFSAQHGNSTSILKAAPAEQSSAPELSFTPTYTIFLPLIMTPPGVPIAPTGLTVTVAATGSIGLSWKAAADGGSPVISYTVNYTPGNVSAPESASCPGGTCSATINSLSNCVAYTFTVKATNAFGSGPSSAPVSGTPVQAADAPAQPSLGFPNVFGARMSVSWSAPNSHGCPIDLYDIQVYRNNAIFTTSVQTALTSATVTGLTTCAYPTGTCGTGYTFHVRAHNAGGWSSNSAGSSAIPKVSYLADNLRGVWSKSYGSVTCTGCHFAGHAPDLATQTGSPPADYQNSSAEGTRMYTCPAHESSCPPGIMSGYSLFTVGSAEYNTVRQWVLDGQYQ